MQQYDIEAILGSTQQARKDQLNAILGFKRDQNQGIGVSRADAGKSNASGLDRWYENNPNAQARRPENPFGSNAYADNLLRNTIARQNSFQEIMTGGQGDGGQGQEANATPDFIQDDFSPVTQLEQSQQSNQTTPQFLQDDFFPVNQTEPPVIPSFLQNGFEPVSQLEPVNHLATILGLQPIGRSRAAQGQAPLINKPQSITSGSALDPDMWNPSPGVRYLGDVLKNMFTIDSRSR